MVFWINSNQIIPDQSNKANKLSEDSAIYKMAIMADR